MVASGPQRTLEEVKEPPRRRWSRRRRLAVASAAVALLGVTVVGALATVPVTPHAILGSDTAYAPCTTGYCPLITQPPLVSFPSGANVTFDWVAHNASIARVYLFADSAGAPGVPQCYWPAAGSGTCEFTAAGDPYFVGIGVAPNYGNTSTTVDYTFSWASPLL